MGFQSGFVSGCSLLVATEDVEFQVGPEGESFFGLKAGCVSHWQTATSRTLVGGFKIGMDQNL